MCVLEHHNCNEETTWPFQQKNCQISELQFMRFFLLNHSHYTLPYVKQIANGNLLYDSGSSNWGPVITWREGKEWEAGGRFKKEGTYVHLWLIHVDVWQKSNQYCKAINQLKINIFKKQLQEDTLTQTQNVAKSVEQIIQFPQQINSINIMEKACYRFKKTYQPNTTCESFWILI